MLFSAQGHRKAQGAALHMPWTVKATLYLLLQIRQERTRERVSVLAGNVNTERPSEG